MQNGMISRVFAWKWDKFPKMGYGKSGICGYFSNLNVYTSFKIRYDGTIKKQTLSQNVCNRSKQL